MAGSTGVGEDADNPVPINVTPMVDVIFCLCLFFMCSFHFKQLEGKIETWLPKDKGVNADEPALLEKDEVRVILQLDSDTKSVNRKVHKFGWARDDDELVSHILTAAAEVAWRTDWPLVIDARKDVPWSEVIHVMDLCKLNNIERLEFGAPEMPSE